MSYQSMWVHGSAAVPSRPDRLTQVSGQAWTDILGDRGGSGATFQADGGHSNAFTFSIPTPAYKSWGPPRRGQARLHEIFFLFRTTGGARIFGVSANDGGRIFTNVIGEPISVFRGPGSTELRLQGNFLPSSFTPPVSDAQFLSLFREGVTVFRLGTTTLAPPQDRPQVFYGVGIQIDVAWDAPGTIAFGGAGAGFFDIE